MTLHTILQKRGRLQRRAKSVPDSTLGPSVCKAASLPMLRNSWMLFEFAFRMLRRSPSASTPNKYRPGSYSIELSVGAEDARPPSGTADMYSMCLCWRVSLRCFVMRSEGLRLPSIFSNPSRFCACASCSHRLWVRICRTFPMPRRCTIPKAALASAYTLA